MASVWVVEKGEYSDYRVVGVYSTRELAERALVAEDRASVSEWPLDPWMDQINQGLQLWDVSMSYDGDATRARKSGLPSECTADDDNHESFHMPQYGPYILRNTGPRVYATVWAASAAHAIKIVNEKRLQAIANSPPPQQPQPEPTDYERFQRLQAEQKR